jgi:hypothetical protein
MSRIFRVQCRGVHVAFRMGIAIGARVQFDNLRANAMGGFGWRLSAAMKIDTRQPASQGSDERNGPDGFFARDLKPTLGRAFFAFFGDDADGVGFVAQGDLLHFSGGGHFEIQQDGQCGHQASMSVSDVTTVFAQVRGCASAPAAPNRSPHRIRRIAATRTVATWSMFTLNAIWT